MKCRNWIFQLWILTKPEVFIFLWKYKSRSNSKRFFPGNAKFSWYTVQFLFLKWLPSVIACELKQWLIDPQLQKFYKIAVSYNIFEVCIIEEEKKEKEGEKKLK